MVAFVLGAIVTMLAALEPFFKFRSLWVEHEETVYRLYRLQDDFNFYLTGKQPTQLSLEKLEEFNQRYGQIWVNLSERWLEYRRSNPEKRPHDRDLPGQSLSPAMTVPQRFVELALALDRHIPGYVDAYFGPPEWKAHSLAGDPRPIAELVQEATELAAAIEQAPTFDAQRRDYLSRHVTAMQTSLRLLQGEPLPLADEVMLLYDITPTWIDKPEFEEVHGWADLLPPGDSLFERLDQRKRSIEISYAQAEPLLPDITQHLRELTRARFPLPDR